MGGSEPAGGGGSGGVAPPGAEKSGSSGGGVGKLMIPLSPAVCGLSYGTQLSAAKPCISTPT